jgi:hypothetical protein
VTEAEWLQCGFFDPMMAYLRDKPNLGRKRRLLAAACCRRVLAWMPEECLPAITMAERLAEGPVAEAERWKAYMATLAAYDVQDNFPQTYARSCAWNAVAQPSDYEQPTSWSDDPSAWVAQTAAQPAAWINGQCDGTILQAECLAITDLIRDIFGNPFRPLPSSITPAVRAWNDAVVVRLGQVAYEERHLPAGTLDSGRLAILADALEEAGCTDADILDHLRGPGPHVRGCWAVDLCLGKA